VVVVSRMRQAAGHGFLAQLFELLLLSEFVDCAAVRLHLAGDLVTESDSLVGDFGSGYLTRAGNGQPTRSQDRRVTG